MRKIVSLVLVALLSALLLVPASAEDAAAELRILMGYQELDPNTDPAALAVEEVTGVHAVYETLPVDEVAATKLMSILAARDADVYDVIIMDYATFSATVGLGAYLPLNDLLSEYGADVLAGTDPALWTNTTIDGDMMGIPYRLSNENYTSGLRVRTDLLASLGLSMPTTLDEFKAVLVAAKEAGLIPLTGSGAIVDEIAGAFGISNVWNVTEDGIHGRPTTPGAKEYVEFMHDLYAEGLLDSEWAQNSTADAQEKFLQGKALMYRVYWWNEPGASETLLANFPEATFDYLPPLKGESGQSGMTIGRGSDEVVVIPRVSSKAAESMQWINAKVASPETFRYLCIGTEGVEYEVNEAGEYVPIQPAFTENRNNAYIYLTATITADYGTYWGQTRVRKNETLYQEFLKMQANVANATIYYDPTTFMAPNSDFTDLAPSVNALVLEKIQNMIVGAEDVADWDAFVQEYLEEGGEDLEAILNEWWAANKEEVEPFIKK